MLSLAVGAYLLSLPARAEPALELALTELSGAVELRSSDTIRAVASGLALPLALPPGARVTVLAGRARFSADAFHIIASAGDTFRYRPVKAKSRRTGLEVTALGPVAGLVLEYRGASAALNEGDSVSLVRTLQGDLELQARGGYLTLSSPGADTVLSPGQTALLRVPPAPAPVEPPELRLEPDEELRSAPGPKR